MKSIIFFICFVLSSNYAFSQTHTVKYNNILERYEYFDSNGTLIKFLKYNSMLKQWEFTNVKNNSRSSNKKSSYYDNIQTYEPNYELINNFLNSREAQYNSRMDAAIGLLKDIRIRINSQFGYGTEKQKIVTEKFLELFASRSKPLEDRRGRIDVFNDSVYRRYKNVVISSYIDAIKFMENNGRL